MALNRLHTKRINENGIIDQQHQGEVINLTVRALETYRKRPASYLCRWTGMPRAKARSRYELRSATAAGRSVCTSPLCISSEAPAGRRNKARRAAAARKRAGLAFGVRLVELTCNSLPLVLLKSLGVLLCQFLSGVTCTNVCENFKERGRAVPIDFDGNWPETNLRPSAAFLHGASVSPLRSGLGLPRVVAFPLLLLNNTNSGLEATHLFLSTGKPPPTAVYSGVRIFTGNYLSFL